MIRRAQKCSCHDRSAYVQRMARYNRWQNENLYGVADRLTDDERRRERGAFFGSIHKTLSHLLWGDHIWMSRFTGVPRPRRHSAIGLALSRLGRVEGRTRALRCAIIGWADASTRVACQRAHLIIRVRRSAR